MAKLKNLRNLPFGSSFKLRAERRHISHILVKVTTHNSMHGKKHDGGKNDGYRLLLGELLRPVVKRVYIHSLNGNPRR